MKPTNGQYYACIIKLDSPDLPFDLVKKFNEIFQIDDDSLEQGIGYDRLGVNTFFVKSRSLINPNNINAFESFLDQNKIKVIFRRHGTLGEHLFVKVFTINLKLDLFHAVRTYLVTKVEKILGKKLKKHDQVYCFSLDHHDPHFQKKKKSFKQIASNSVFHTIAGFDR